jgi:hypothetical protein
MCTIFPELITSTNITFVPPSKRGRSRFPLSDPNPQPLARWMLVEYIFQDRIRRQLTIVADASVRLVPALLMRLSDKQKARREWMTTYANKLEAIRKVQKLNRKEDAGYWCIKNLMELPTRPSSLPVRSNRYIARQMGTPTRSNGNPFKDDEETSSNSFNTDYDYNNSTLNMSSVFSSSAGSVGDIDNLFSSVYKTQNNFNSSITDNSKASNGSKTNSDPFHGSSSTTNPFDDDSERSNSNPFEA